MTVQQKFKAEWKMIVFFFSKWKKKVSYDVWISLKQTLGGLIANSISEHTKKVVVSLKSKEKSGENPKKKSLNQYFGAHTCKSLL